MRLIDVRNLIGKAFCDYLLTGEEKFREIYLRAEVSEEFETYKRKGLTFTRTL